MPSASYFLLESLKRNGADSFISVPCKLLAEFIALVTADPEIVHVAATREEEGIGIAVGAYLAGRMPVVAMQNSGLGNSINALASLALLYQIPMLLLISHRGTPGERIAAQVPMGLATEPMLDAIGIPHFAFSQGSEAEAIGELIGYSRVAGRPVAALLDFRFWQGGN